MLIKFGGALYQIIQAGFIRVFGFAGMDDLDRAFFRRLDQVLVRTPGGILDVGLLIAVVGEDLVVDLDAVFTTGAQRRVDIGIVEGRGLFFLFLLRGCGRR